MTTACIYLRLSAKSKGERNVVNLATQEADCRKLAKEHGATVVEVFKDYGQSAFDRDNPDDRPQYAALCDAMRRKELDIVLAWHTDRLWRDNLEQAMFVRDAQRSGLKLVVTKTARIDPQNPDDEFLLSILTAVAKKESADKRRRITSKMAANAAAGLPAGTGANRPFGYETDRVTIVPAEAAVIREACARLLNGETLRSVTAWLNAAGIGTVHGRPWDTTRIRDIAVSPRYAGKRAVGKRANAVVVADAVWDGIIDAQTSDRLRALLLDPERRTNRSARSYLLSSLVVCSLCEQSMRSHPRYDRTGADGQRARDYSCSTGSDRPLACGRMMIHAAELEQMVGAAVARRFVDLAAADVFAPPADAVNDAISVEVATIDTKTAKLGADWAADRITDAAYYAAQAGLVERRAQLSAMVRRNVTTLPPIFAELAAHPERVVTDWPTYTFDRQRALIAATIEHVVIAPNATRGARGFDPTRVRIVWMHGDR